MHFGLIGLLGVALALGLATGCSSGDDGLDRGEATTQLSRRLSATPEQADCMIDLLADDYDDAAVKIIAAEGVEELPQGQWEPYFTAALVCLTDDRP